MSSTRLIETSKFLSYVLRHEPQAIGLVLDSEGWGDIEALIAGAMRQGRALDRALIEEVVATSEKKRFSISTDGSRIRAVQGHSSSNVDRSFGAKVPPQRLFHGTTARSLESIRHEGLKPGKRHYVHLSADEHTARTVGQRHGSPVVLAVNVALMHQHGFVFHQAENGVWLIASVPPQFLSDANE